MPNIVQLDGFEAKQEKCWIKFGNLLVGKLAANTTGESSFLKTRLHIRFINLDFSLYEISFTITRASKTNSEN